MKAKRWPPDRALLVAAAVVVFVVLAAGGTLVFELLGMSGWRRVWLYGVMFFVPVIGVGVSELRRRRPKLHRTWPLGAVFVLFVVFHVLAFDWLVVQQFPNWWRRRLFVALVEAALFSVVMELAYGVCRRRRLTLRV